MTDKSYMAKCFTAGGILLIISMFANLVSIINNYESYLENTTSYVISAFNGWWLNFLKTTLKKVVFKFEIF